MALIAGEILDEARDYHEAFYPEHLPDGMCLRQLSRLEQRFAQRLVLEVPDSITTSETFEAADLENAAEYGVPLTPSLLPVALSAGFGAERPEEEVRLVAESEAHEDNLPPGLRAFRRGGMIYPVGPRWEAVVSLRHSYAPNPPPLTSLEDELTLPDACGPALVSSLALWMASRRGVLKELPRIDEEAQESTATMIQVLGNQTTTIHHRIRAAR
jgi:hypothetical protein